MARDQAQLFYDCIPQENRNKLDTKLDADHDGVQRHLGEIANAMDEWEGSVADALGLTKVDVANIRSQHRDSLTLQTCAVLHKWREKNCLQATYRALIKAFLDAGKPDFAEAVCKVLGGTPGQKNGASQVGRNRETSSAMSQTETDFPRHPLPHVSPAALKSTQPVMQLPKKFEISTSPDHPVSSADSQLQQLSMTGGQLSRTSTSPFRQAGYLDRDYEERARCDDVLRQFCEICMNAIKKKGNLNFDVLADVTKVVSMDISNFFRRCANNTQSPHMLRADFLGASRNVSPLGFLIGQSAITCEDFVEQALLYFNGKPEEFYQDLIKSFHNIPGGEDLPFDIQSVLNRLFSGQFSLNCHYGSRVQEIPTGGISPQTYSGNTDKLEVSAKNFPPFGSPPSLSIRDVVTKETSYQWDEFRRAELPSLIPEESGSRTGQKSVHVQILKKMAVHLRHACVESLATLLMHRDILSAKECALYLQPVWSAGKSKQDHLSSLLIERVKLPVTADQCFQALYLSLRDSYEEASSVPTNNHYIIAQLLLDEAKRYIKCEDSHTDTFSELSAAIDRIPENESDFDQTKASRLMQNLGFQSATKFMSYQQICQHWLDIVGAKCTMGHLVLALVKSGLGKLASGLQPVYRSNHPRFQNFVMNLSAIGHTTSYNWKLLAYFLGYKDTDPEVYYVDKHCPLPELKPRMFLRVFRLPDCEQEMESVVSEISSGVIKQRIVTENEQNNAYQVQKKFAPSKQPSKSPPPCTGSESSIKQPGQQTPYTSEWTKGGKIDTNIASNMYPHTDGTQLQRNFADSKVQATNSQAMQSGSPIHRPTILSTGKDKYQDKSSQPQKIISSSGAQQIEQIPKDTTKQEVQIPHQSDNKQEQLDSAPGKETPTIQIMPKPTSQTKKESPIEPQNHPQPRNPPMKLPPPPSYSVRASLLDTCMIGNDWQLVDAILDSMQLLGEELHSDAEGKTAFHYVCRDGNIGRVKRMIAKGAKVTHIDKIGQSVLHYNAVLKNEQLLKILLIDFRNKSVSVDVCDKESFLTPLMMVCTIGDAAYGSAKLLLEYGANPNGNPKAHCTPLIVACQGAHDTFELVDLLVERGADINKQDKDGYTLLLKACTCRKWNVAKYVLDQPHLTTINRSDRAGTTPLFEAVSQSNPEMVELLLSKGARTTDVRLQSNNVPSLGSRSVEETPFVHACRHGMLEIAKLLVKYNVDVNYKCSGSVPAIVFALVNQKNTIVHYLLHNCEKLDTTIYGLSTPIVYSVKVENNQCTKLMLDKLGGVARAAEEAEKIGMIDLLQHINQYRMTSLTTGYEASTHQSHDTVDIGLASHGDQIEETLYQFSKICMMVVKSKIKLSDLASVASADNPHAPEIGHFFQRCAGGFQGESSFKIDFLGPHKDSSPLTYVVQQGCLSRQEFMHHANLYFQDNSQAQEFIKRLVFTFHSISGDTESVSWNGDIVLEGIFNGQFSLSSIQGQPTYGLGAQGRMPQPQRFHSWGAETTRETSNPVTARGSRSADVKSSDEDFKWPAVDKSQHQTSASPLLSHTSHSSTYYGGHEHGAELYSGNSSLASQPDIVCKKFPNEPNHITKSTERQEATPTPSSIASYDAKASVTFDSPHVPETRESVSRGESTDVDDKDEIAREFYQPSPNNAKKPVPQAESQSHPTLDSCFPRNPQSFPATLPTSHSELILSLDKNHLEITRSIREIDNEDLIKLGQALGLARYKLKRMEDMPADMVAAWLRQEDDVIKTTGDPAWSTLADKLDYIDQCGYAKKIREAHNIPQQSESIQNNSPPTDCQEDEQCVQLKTSLAENGLMLGKEDIQVLIENGITTWEAFKDLTSENFKEMKITMGGRKLLSQLQQFKQEMAAQAQNTTQSEKQHHQPSTFAGFSQATTGNRENEQQQQSTTPQKTIQAPRSRVTHDHSEVGKLELVMTGGGGGFTGKNKKEVVTLEFKAPLPVHSYRDEYMLLTEQPKSQSIMYGDEVLLEVNATLTGPGADTFSKDSVKYQWFKDNLKITLETHPYCRGANESTLHISAVLPQYEGNYKCEVCSQDRSESVSSKDAALQVVSQASWLMSQCSESPSKSITVSPTVMSANQSSNFQLLPLVPPSLEVVDCNGKVLLGPDDGININVPPGAVPESELVHVQIQTFVPGSNDPIDIPHGLKLFSPIYHISTFSKKFQKDVELLMFHYAKLLSGSDTSKLTFLHSTDKTPPYRFTELSSGEFDYDSCSGTVHLQSFCKTAVAGSVDIVEEFIVYFIYPIPELNSKCMYALFSACYSHNAYRKYLEKEMEKKFQNAKPFYTTSDIVELAEDSQHFELIIPHEDVTKQGYVITILGRNTTEISVKDIQKSAKAAAAFPARFHLLHVKPLHNSTRVGDLKCDLVLSGAKEIPKPYVLRARAEGAILVSKTEAGASVKTAECAYMYADAIRYLDRMDRKQIVRLGTELGLNVFNVENMKNLPDDMLRAWFRKEDRVKEKCNDSITWETLVEALRKIEQNGIADDIRKEKCEKQSESVLAADLQEDDTEGSDLQSTDSEPSPKHETKSAATIDHDATSSEYSVESLPGFSPKMSRSDFIEWLNCNQEVPDEDCKVLEDNRINVKAFTRLNEDDLTKLRISFGGKKILKELVPAVRKVAEYCYSNEYTII